MMVRHKRTATKSTTDAKALKVMAAYYDRVPLTFLVPKALAAAITDAATHSGNLLCKDVVVTDHLILAKPRLSTAEKTILKATSKRVSKAS